jgi:hypothetical protein
LPNGNSWESDVILENFLSIKIMDDFSGVVSDRRGNVASTDPVLEGVTM